MSDRASLLGLRCAALEELVQAAGQPAYRGRQLAAWLYQHGARDFAAMTDLPAGLRADLAGRFDLGRSTCLAEQVSRDGTRKLLLGLADGAAIETVVLPYDDRVSTCVSSQTGCAIACTFCATGRLGAGRNLTVGEITDQLLTAGETIGRRVSHVVFMGMGEPLLNLPTVVETIRLWRDELGLSPRNVTVSTVGLPPAMAELADADLPITLALSLHAADDALRRELVPTVARRWSTAELVAAARAYFDRTGRRVTFEMALMAEINDRPADAEALARLLRAGDHVNLIPFNDVAGSPFGRPTREALTAYRARLEQAGLTVTQRMQRGADIDGACGQLRAARTQTSAGQ